MKRIDCINKAGNISTKILMLVQTIDKRRYKIHLEFAAVKDFNVFI